jgi:hypothetical protein
MGEREMNHIATGRALSPRGELLPPHHGIQQRRWRWRWSLYVHFASLFCIIIFCYSLIYFIFRDDTYVVSPVFTCLMIIGGFAAGVRILLENDRQDTIFWEIRKIPEKYEKIIFCRKTQEARRRR